MADEPTAEAEVIAESGQTAEAVDDTVERAESSIEETAPEGEAAASADEPNAVEEAPPAEGDAQPTPEPALPDLSGLTVTQLRELNPELAQQVEYAGAQSKEAELRRIQGSKEATAARMKELRAASGITEEAASDEDLNFLDTNNYANAGHRYLGDFAQQWAKAWEPTAEERDTISAAAATGDINTYAMTVLHTGARHLGLTQAYEMDIADVPADTPLARSAAARANRRQSADTKADEMEDAQAEANPRPTAAAGQPVGATSQDDVDLQRLQERGIPLTDQKTRQRLAAQLGVKLPI